MARSLVLALALRTITVAITAGTPMAIMTTTITGHAIADPIAGLIAAADPAAVHIAPVSVIGAMAAAIMSAA